MLMAGSGLWLVGLGGLPGEPQGCAGSHEEPHGDEQDTEVGQRWNCPDEIR